MARPLGQGFRAAAGSARVTTVPGGRARGDFLQSGFPAVPGGLRMAISLPKMQTEIKGTEGTGEKSIAFGESEGHSWLMQVRSRLIVFCFMFFITLSGAD